MRGLVLAVVLLAGCDQVFGLDRPGGDVPPLPGFDQRKKIRIVANTLEPLIEFPVALIRQADADLIAGVKTGRDFAVTSEDGEVLPIELERFDATTGALLLWVLVPEIAPDTETSVYLYYGGESQPVDLPTTWPEPYGAVWHLAATEDSETDSTRNRLRLSRVTTTPPSERGPLGNARRFDGQSDQMTTPHTVALDAGATSFSVSLWLNVKASRSGTDMPLHKGGASISEPGYDWELGLGDWQAQISDGTTKIILEVGTAELEDTWRQLATVVDREMGFVRAYLDGSLVLEQPLAGFGSMSSTRVLTLGGPDAFEGSLDEVRIYHGAWSTSRLAAEFRNVTAPESFLLVGATETLR